MSNDRPAVPRPPPSVTLLPADPTLTPKTLTQLKYALFSWPNNPVTKRDPIAREYFKSNSQMSNFVATLGGFPLTLWEGALPGRDKPVELFLSGDQCQTLRDGLASKMGPSRAKATWNKDAVHDYSSLARSSGVTAWSFPDQASIEERFSQLKALNDFYETRNHFAALRRAQDVVTKIQEEGTAEARFIAIDVETYEQDHDLVLEIGFAKSVWRQGKFEVMETRHFVVRENAHRRNGRYCPDARDYFHFGRSELVDADSLADLLRFELESPSSPVFLLFHDSRSDVKSLQLLGFSTSIFSHASPLPSPDSESGYTDMKGKGKWILDSQVLYSGYNRQKKQAKLSDAVRQLGISLKDPTGELEGLGGYRKKDEGGGGGGPWEAKGVDELKFHNSGNDAWATLAVFWKLMGMMEGKSE